MIDLLLVALSLGCGASGMAAYPSAWMAALAVTATGLLAAALLFRRSGLLVAAVAASALCQVAVCLAQSPSRLWQALGWGFVLLVLLDLGSDRLSLARTRITGRAYVRRIGFLARCAAISAAAVLCAVSLGSASVGLWRGSVPFVAAVLCAVAVGTLVAGLIALALRRKDSD